MATNRLTHPEQLLEFKISNFNVVAATIGGFLSIFSLISYLLKERFYLSEALISLLGGLVFSPHALDWIRPLEYAQNSIENQDSITLYFTRLVLGVQLVIAGIQLPSKYLKIEWRSLSLLLGPIMCSMWMATSLLVWAMVPNLTFLHALAIGSCVTPTDPVLSNSIVKGKFADHNIPKDLQKVIIAESGANDGLGYPFLFLALYLIRYTGDGGLGQDGNAGTAMGYWFGITWGYVIIMSVIYGAVVGYVFRKLLRWAEDRKYVDKESFLVFAITLALFIVGTLGMLGADDVLACFIAGNVFTWDDWFRLRTEDDSFQPTIDMLLNVTIFAWYGAVCPWYSFVHNDGIIPIYRLIFLGILVLLFRRLPWVYLLHKKIPQIEQWRQAIYVGFFGPIGVSAVFYLYTSKEYLAEIEVDGVQREDARRLSDTIEVVVWFMAICSIVVHGMTIPLSKFGWYLPRTISKAVSIDRSTDLSRNKRDLERGVTNGQGNTRQPRPDDSDEPQLPFHIDARIHGMEEARRRHRTASQREHVAEQDDQSRGNAFQRFFRIGRRTANHIKEDVSEASKVNPVTGEGPEGEEGEGNSAEKDVEKDQHTASTSSEGGGSSGQDEMTRVPQKSSVEGRDGGGGRKASSSTEMTRKSSRVDGDEAYTPALEKRRMIRFPGEGSMVPGSESEVIKPARD